jgi:hypothetical protein
LLVRAQHTLSMLMQAFSTALMMWISGLIYGYRSTPDTPAEIFAERVVIREDDCICLQMTSRHRPALITESPTEGMNSPLSWLTFVYFRSRR